MKFFAVMHAATVSVRVPVRCLSHLTWHLECVTLDAWCRSRCNRCLGDVETVFDGRELGIMEISMCAALR